jgi:hypothetical protein
MKPRSASKPTQPLSPESIFDEGTAIDRAMIRAVREAIGVKPSKAAKPSRSRTTSKSRKRAA